MDIVIPEIVNENTVAFGFFLTLSLLGVSIKIVTGMISFYEEVLIKRYFKRLNSLSEHVPQTSIVNDYLIQVKENEVFRLASGIKVSPEKSQMLMDIYLLGLADNRELKRLHRYMKPFGDKVFIDVDWFDKLQISYSLLAALYLLISGLIFGGPYFLYGEGTEVLAGLLIMTMLTVTAAIVGTDFRTYRVLKRVRSRLIEQGRVSNPYSKIMWNSPWKKNIQSNQGDE